MKMVKLHPKSQTRISDFLKILIIGSCLITACNPNNDEQSNDKTKLKVIVFMDYWADETNDNKERVLTEFAQIEKILFPQNVNLFKSHSLVLYPLYYQTATCDQIFANKADKEAMKSKKHDIKQAKGLFYNNLISGFKEFDRICKGENGSIHDATIKIMESVDVFTHRKFRSSINEKIIIVYLSEFMEIACDHNTASDECLNFKEEYSSSFDLAQVNLASSNLADSSSILFNTVKERRKNLPIELSSADMYLLPLKFSKVSSPDGTNKGDVMEFWIEYFGACGFKNVYQISSFEDIDV